MKNVLPIALIPLVLLILVSLGLWGPRVLPVSGMLDPRDADLPAEEQADSQPTAQPSVTVPAVVASADTPVPTPTVAKLQFTPSPDILTPTRQPAATPAATSIPPTPLSPSSLTLTPPASGRFLLVDQDQQIMYVFNDAVLIREVPVSTGAPVSNAFTPAWRGEVGHFWGKAAFRNTDLWADYIWYLFPGAEGSILIHSVPYTRNGDEKVYDRLEALGVEPASAGCIRISPEDAEWLSRWNPVGVDIEITTLSAEIRDPDDPQ